MVCKCFGIDYYTIFDQDKNEETEPDDENLAIENNAQIGKISKIPTSFEDKLGINGNNKFQKLVKKIDDTVDQNGLDPEINKLILAIKTYIEN